MSELILYIGSKNVSSWSLRPWLLLDHYGVPFTERLIKLNTPTTRQEILKFSATGKVPFVEHGACRVGESLAIAEYFNEVFPELQLWPLDPAHRAHARSISNEMHAGFPALRTQCSHNVLADTEKTEIDEPLAQEISRINAIWNECLTEYGGPYLFGSRLTIADAMYAPVVNRFVTYHLKPTGLSQQYISHIRRLPSMKRWIDAAKRGE